jgi:hypothetical protein
MHATPLPCRRCLVTAALAGHVDRIDLPPEPGVSCRAVRSVFRMMAKIAQDSGEFRYGLRGSKLATLTDYSLSVVRRAQRYLVEHGYLERVVVGGGRSSTRWRIVVANLAPQLASRHNSSAVETRQAERDDTAQERRPWFSRRMDRPAPAPKSVTPPSMGELRTAPLCNHGGDARRLPDGRPKCPLCRRGAP